jgi:hypothetical protein
MSISVVGGEAEHMDATLQSWTCFIAGVVEAGLLQGISLSSKERFQFDGPVILNPHTSACDVRAVAATSSSCHVFDGPHEAAPRHGACHTAFRSILAHIDIKPLPPLHQHYFAAGQWACVWLAVLAVCRRPAAYSSVGQLGRESQKRGTSSVGPCSVACGQKRMPYGLPVQTR